MTNESTAQPLRAPDAVEQALTLHQQGRFDEAAQIYDAVLAADPNNFDALHLGGVLRHQQGRSVEGLRLVAAALRAQPRAADALINYGVILDALKRHQDA
ncbi:MAG: tetratricopeptide repeat protein, partial [Xanthobacteraceae bacterium]